MKQEHECIDDFGTAFYKCRYTKEIISAEETAIVGSIMPLVGSTMKPVYFVKKGEGQKRHKQSGIWFHESEQNCNTCKNLKRVKSDKNKSGFLFGTCENRIKGAHPYESRFVDGVMTFHPDDPMNMPCYASRWTK